MKNFKRLEEGSAVIRFSNADRSQKGLEPYATTIWIGKNNVSLMIDKEEQKQFLFLLS